MEPSVDTLLEQIEKLVTGQDKPRDFKKAYSIAVQGEKIHPTEPRLWSQLILLSNLTNYHIHAIMLQKEAAQQCGDQWTNIPDGDCDRDHALYCIRRRRPEDALKFLRQARRKHKDHLERMALLHVVEGRFWYSWKHYAVALQCFIRAMETYEELASCIENGAATESPNQQWRFNSDRWLLKTLVMLYGPRNQWSRTVWDSLQKRMATYGSPDINVRLQLVMKFGRFGNKIDDFIESSVGRAILAQPRLYRFTAACFEKS